VESKAGTPTKLPSLSEWRAHIQGRGVRDDIARSYLEYIRPLTKRAIPVIFDRNHLAALLGRTPDFLAKVTAAPNHFYRTFEIPKKSGGSRRISSPYPSLKECQQWIAKEILLRLPLHATATAYAPGRSIFDHVKPHMEKGHEILIVDLKDFFPSISKKRVIGYFRSIGYNHEVSVALGSLCCLHGCLPQGSPASPHLSNLLALKLDRRLSALASNSHLAYTRYADDLCFSGENIGGAIRHIIESAVSRSGFLVNAKKTRFFSAGSTAKVVTGINISSGECRLPKSKRRELSQTMHFIEAFGYLSHKAKKKILDPKYLIRLRGNIEFWRMAEPQNERVRIYLEKLSHLQRIHGDG